MKRALVTGATGFIGHHLVQRLIAQGADVKCLVRSLTRSADLSQFDVTLVQGDLADGPSLAEAVKDVDVVYHLAGLTKSVSDLDLMQVNGDGARNLAIACAQRTCPPTLVVVSSLAAAGPTLGSDLRVETDAIHPVSKYGRSKRAGELAVIEFADQVPTTIVRPPIVFGEYDRDVLHWFKMLQQLGIHLTPGLRNYYYSVIHADDLVSALILVAENGSRVTGAAEDDAGIYYAACDEVMTYSDLGRLIGDCVGRTRPRVIRAPMFMIWGLALGCDLWGRIRRHPMILNLDKAREAAAGGWACSAAKLRRDTEFVPAMSLEERLRQTADWYLRENWL
ncbi:MAG: NAD-dependent epimerase/dehydratase family protein [Rubripirellula sp.]|nr:NAD-dependent epimerase/dehydratase family protein [Rubripirellula sp.]